MGDFKAAIINKSKRFVYAHAVTGTFTTSKIKASLSITGTWPIPWQIWPWLDPLNRLLASLSLRNFGGLRNIHLKIINQTSRDRDIFWLLFIGLIQEWDTIVNKIKTRD